MVVSTVVVRRARRLLGAAAVAVLFGATLSGCYLDEAQQLHETTPDARPWFCVSHGVGGHHGDNTAVADPAYAGQTKGALSWDDCLSVAASFDEVVAYASQWPTQRDAEAGGWSEQTSYGKGLGTHHMNMSNLGSFNPTRPAFLQYGSDDPDAPLVGVSWWVSSGDRPPEGFAGNNDWWHEHGALCFVGTRVIDDGQLSDDQCRFFGGNISRFPGYHMLHAWIIPGFENKVDMFAGTHPCLLEKGVAPPEDPCWAEAAGTGQPGTDPGEHGMDHGDGTPVG
jgi:hypothetical protein